MIATCLDKCIYQVSSPHIVVNLLAVACLSYTYTSGFMEVEVYIPPFGVQRKPPSTHLKNLTMDAYLEEKSQKSKKLVKGCVRTPINPSPINTNLTQTTRPILI